MRFGMNITLENYNKNSNNKNKNNRNKKNNKRNLKQHPNQRNPKQQSKTENQSKNKWQLILDFEYIIHTYTIIIILLENWNKGRGVLSRQFIYNELNMRCNNL